MPSRIIQSFKKKRLVLATIVYWILLLYIIVALVWWYIALERQSQQMTTYRMNELLPSDPAYIIKKQKILDEKKNETTQYIGEGATFLALILVGAVFVYRAVLRQINLQQQQQNFMMAI
ncbi:MAG TPA: hypothetical protein VM012_14505, partial [Flavitalea sp.]|nr:hypothetical protein [Flavitalea sp.]